MDVGGSKSALFQRVDELEERLVAIARGIHSRPELNFREYYATRLLTEAMAAEGFTVQQPVGGLDTAFVASLQEEPGPCIAFLAEYDALPELGHACGHNLIAAAAVGAALALSAVLRPLPGRVLVIGTPAEEGGGGKAILAERGVFEELDAAMMFHPAGEHQLWKYALASRIVRIEFYGKASHAASAPEEGINALDATIQTFNSVNALRQHLRKETRIHGIILHGGTAPNIVPDYSASIFYLRAFEDRYCDELIEKLRACAEGAAAATGARLEYRQEGAYDSLLTNMPLTEAFRRNAELLGIDFAKNDPLDDIGSTDMGNVSHIAPAIHPYLAIGAAPLIFHTNGFAEAAGSERGMRMMLLAAKALATTGFDFLTDPELRQRVADDFRQGLD